MCGVKYLVLVLCSLELLAPTVPLKLDDEGVCQVKTSFQKTRWRTYLAQTKKMCGKKRCVVKKSKRETFLATKNQPVCCNGWQYKADNDSCAPFCSTGCTGGRCIRPETCHCEPPSILDEEHRNVCIFPTCNPPCINGVCIANDTCQCSNGFDQYNSTHCSHCDPGYTIDNDFNCAPVCDQECVNGNCIGPNICGCRSGYKINDAYTCEPVCEKACINSICTSPNVCSCLDGYADVNGTCEPQCESCANGRCVGPNVCECDDGYENVDGSCVPPCDAGCATEACSNGLCTCKETADSGQKCSCDGRGKCVDCSVPLRNFENHRLCRTPEASLTLECCHSYNGYAWAPVGRCLHCISYAGRSPYALLMI